MHHLLGFSTSQINGFLIILSLRGISSIKPQLVRKAESITPDILLQMYSYKFLDLKKARDTVFWCLFLFAFFLFARKSNLVPDTQKFLLRQDVKELDDILIVTIKWSKTIQFGQRILQIPLIKIPDSVLCPYQAFKTCVKW